MNACSFRKMAGRAGVLLGLTGFSMVVALTMGTTGAGAVEYGNPDYQNVLDARPPTGFPVSPASLDLSKGPVTITFGVPVTNLTKSTQTVVIDFSVHRILTFQGKDISDGQPGQPGISFPPGAPKLTTQAMYGARQSATFTVPAGMSTSTVISFTAPIANCGYYQIDFNSPTKPPEYLAAGFTRALGCTTAQVTPPPTTTPTTAPPAAVLGTTVTSPAAPTTTAPARVLALRVGAQLPATGATNTLFVIGGVLLALGIVLAFAARCNNPA